MMIGLPARMAVSEVPVPTVRGQLLPDQLGCRANWPGSHFFQWGRTTHY